MRFAGHYCLLGVASAAMLATVVRADDLAVSGNPYSTITERNVFALVPIPPPAPATPEVVADPPPKITVNGLMTLLGSKQVLFKFTPKAPPGQPAKEVSLMLGEGERQEDVEVTKIDMTAHMVSFINHGHAEDVPLSDTAKLTAPAPAAGPGGIPMPVATSGGGIPMPGSVQPSLLARGALAGRGPGAASTPATAPGNTATTLATAAAATAAKDAKDAENLTPEERAILIEAQRLKYQDAKNPMANMLPPTKFTPKTPAGTAVSPGQ